MKATFIQRALAYLLDIIIVIMIFSIITIGFKPNSDIYYPVNFHYFLKKKIGVLGGFCDLKHPIIRKVRYCKDNSFVWMDNHSSNSDIYYPLKFQYF